jgi:hypothetical protein
MCILIKKYFASIRRVPSFLFVSTAMRLLICVLLFGLFALVSPTLAKVASHNVSLTSGSLDVTHTCEFNVNDIYCCLSDVCLNIRYEPSLTNFVVYGVFDSVVLYEQTFGLDMPPRVCVDVYDFHLFGRDIPFQICAEINDIVVSPTEVSACFQADLFFYDTELFCLSFNPEA